MKIMKSILFILVLLILSGCTVESNITMDYAGKVKEETKLLIPSEQISNKKDRIDSYVQTAINNSSKAIKARNYKYEIINDVKTNSGALLYKDYDNICDFVNNTIFSQYLYKRIDCTEDEYYYEIKSVTNHIDYCGDCNDWPSIENVELKINLPITATESDADKINDNTYIWNFNKDTSNNKSIYLKLSKESLNQNKIKVDTKKQRMKKFKESFIIIFILVFLITICFIAMKFYKKYKNSKNEY